jgi:acetyl esterase/lipase
VYKRQADQRLLAAALRAVLRLTLGRTFRADVPLETQRKRLLGVSRLTLPPRAARFTAADCGGVPGEWVQARTAAQAPLTVLYLHGGGYCTGAPASHRALAGHLAVHSGARVFVADYRLAPEHPFPAALDDAVGAWRGLLAQGIPPEQIAIAGDSAGGGLAVAAALRLRELALPLPRALVLFSPWVDLGLGQLCREAPEAMLNEQWLRAGARNMQGIARVPIDITSIIQGLIIVFIAAPEIIRLLYRMRDSRRSTRRLSSRTSR